MANNRIDGIEGIQDDDSKVGMSDSAQQAIMQAALQKAQQSGAVEATKEQQESAGSIASKDDNKLSSIKGLDSKTTEKMLTSSIDQIALNNLNMLGININKNAEQKTAAQEAMMQAAMNRANPATNTEATKEMANVSQGTSAISDASKKDETSIQTQQVYETGASAKMQEAKESGLAMGVRIEQPDALSKQPAPEKLLAGSMEQMAASNMSDLGISAASGAGGA